MLDGRALGASQVEYKPFGKPPLQRKALRHPAAGSDAVLAASLPECFFHHSHAQPSILAWAQDCHTQSWRGHRIATLNPGVGTGLPHSILAWAQDCHTQSWCGHRIASVFPRKRWKRSAVQHYAPRLAARIARKTPAVHRCTPGLAARIARKTTEAHCCIAGCSRKTPPASCCVAVH